VKSNFQARQNNINLPHEYGQPIDGGAEGEAQVGKARTHCQFRETAPAACSGWGEMGRVDVLGRVGG
jgi:hypothetical protein